MGSPEGDRRREFEALASRLQHDLFAFAYRLTGDREDAEDLAQDALVRAYRGFDRFEPGSRFKAWIFRITTRVYLNAYRRRRSRPTLMAFEAMGTEGEPYEVADPRMDDRPEAALLREQEARAAWKAVESLEDPFRLTFILCEVEELSYEEVAAAMGVPVGTVRSRLSRARTRLRQRLSLGEEVRR